METTSNIKKEITMGTGEANIKAMVFILPVLLIFGVPFLWIWRDNLTITIIDAIFSKTFILLFIIIAGIVVHELIHGLFWSFYLKKGFKSIKFGVNWKHLTPYCHSKEAMKMKHYRLGAIMPGLILGIVPCLVALFNGSSAIMAFGILFTMAAGGDFLMIWLMRKEGKNALVQDHPDKIGCIILEN